MVPPKCPLKMGPLGMPCMPLNDCVPYDFDRSRNLMACAQDKNTNSEMSDWTGLD